MDVATIVLSALTGPAAAAASVWFLRVLVEHRMKHEFQVKLAALQHYFARDLALFENRLTNVTGKRIEALVKLYRLLDRAVSRTSAACSNFLCVSTADVFEAEKDLAARADRSRGVARRHLDGCRPLLDDDIFKCSKDILESLARCLVSSQHARKRDADGRQPAAAQRCDDRASEEMEKAKKLLETINLRAKELMKVEPPRR